MAGVPREGWVSDRSGLTVERALADEVVADAADAFGALRLVSTALAETWERRTGNELTLAGYALSGRVAGAVARLAEDTWSSMSADVQAAARRILLRLVRPADGAGGETRLRARPQDVVPPDHPAATDALRTLVDRRLLMLDGKTVEITHDALLGAWPRLADWLAQDVDSRRLHHHVAAAAAWWADGGHADDDLLRGARLAAAVEWRDSGRADDLNEIEHRYLEASVGLSDEQLASAHRQAQGQRQANRRLRVLAAAIALLLVAATVAGAVAVRQADHADAAALEADAERLGALAGLERDLDRSLLLAVQATEMADTASTTGALLRAVQRSPRAVGMIRSESARLLALELDPSGRIVAVNENLGGTTLYEVATNRRIGHWGTTNALQALAFAPDGTAFATVDIPDPESFEAFDVVVVDVATLTERARYTGRRDPVSDVAFSPDGRRLVAAPGDRGSGLTPELTVWDVARPGPPARRVELPDATIRDNDELSFDVTGHHVAVSVVDATAIIDLDTGERTASVEGSGGLFGPDGRTIAVNRDAGTQLRELDLVDVATGRRRALLGAHDERIVHRAFSRDGDMLATAADDRTVRVWETATGRELFVLAGHTGRVLSAEFSPDGTSLYSTGLDRTIITWDLAARRTIERTLLPSTTGEVAVEAIALTSDESTLVAIGIGNAQLVAVDLATGRATEAVDTGHGVAYSLLPSGGSTVITGGDDGSIRRWNASTGERLAELTPNDGEPGFFPLAVTTDAATVYLQTGHDTLQAYDTVTLTARPGTEVDVGAGIIAGAVSADGHTLAVSTFEPPAIKLVDVATSRVRSIDVPGDVAALGFSPDGSVVAAGDFDGRVFRIDVSATAMIGEAAVSHDGPVLGIAYSDDGRQYTSDSTDGTVGLWDADGQLLGAVQPGPPNDLARSKWSTDGRTLIVTYANMSAFAFDIRPESWIDYACATAGRRLTEPEWSEVIPDRSYDPACE